MRDTQPLSRDLRNLLFWWSATLALLLAACLNPRPEELPSSQGREGAGAPTPGDENENVALDRDPTAPAPAYPGGAVDPDPPDSSEPTTGSNEPSFDGDAGADTPPDAATPDAGG